MKMLFFIISLFIYSVNCELIFWNVTKWSDCKIKTNCLENGLKERNIRCTNFKNNTFLNEACTKQVGYTPKTQKHCVPIDCYNAISSIMHKKTLEWSNCYPVLEKHKNITQHENLKHQIHCDTNQLVKTYIKHRKVRCVVNYKNTSVTLDVNICRKVFKIDKEYKLCFHQCLDNCSLSSWSKWQSCKQCREQNIKYKTRYYTNIHPEHNWKVQNNFHYPSMIKQKMINKLVYFENKVQYKISNWDEGSEIHEKRKDQHIPTYSIAKRNITCLTNNGEKCSTQSDGITSIKIINTKRDCKYSDWSKWSHCHYHPSNYINYRVRKREIELLPIGNGQPCDLLRERKQCNYHKRNKKIYKSDWLIGDWTECTKETKKLNCDIYVQHRNIFCANISDKYLKPISENHCLHLKKLSTERICKTKCHKNCSNSYWSHWSNCQNQTKHRYRININKYNHNECNHIVQKQSCDQFQWKKINSSECIPDSNNDNKVCGPGIIKHTLKCVNMSVNLIVLNVYCNNSVKLQSEEPCNKLCPNDCIVNSWSEWYFDSNQTKTRVRNIISNFDNKTCPALIENNKNYNDFVWLSSNWNDCKTNATNKNQVNRTCHIGYKERNIYCINLNNNDVLNNSFCENYVKPKSIKPCEICLKDCIVSTWSHWDSHCLSVCNSYHTEIQPKITRKRFIIKFPSKHGEKCPNKLIETKECELCPNYEWITSKWDVCLHNTVPSITLGHNQVLQKGLQVRSVYCSDGYRKVNDETCLNLNQPKPLEVRECQINWMITCYLKQWSDWSKCNSKCNGGTQSRRRRYNLKECKTKAPLHDEPLFEERICNNQLCTSYDYHIGAWSTCHPIFNNQPCNHNRFYTTMGIQYRNITCQIVNGTIVANQYCEELTEEKLLPQRNCIVPCKRDCLLSSWSAYSQCSSTCGFGTKTRFRTITHASSNGGKKCPKTNYGTDIAEVHPCKETKCFQLKWKPMKWSACKLNKSFCGEGQRTRGVVCHDSKETVNDTNCTHLDKPSSIELCNISCKNTCIVSTWSEWSECENDHVFRRREILSTPTGVTCPKLIEQKYQKCDSYSWNATLWSTCTLLKEGSLCGLGMQKRSLNCIKNSLHVVEPKFCKHLDGSEQHKKCEIQCEKDCEVSIWSTWSHCENKCGQIGYKKRKRFVLSESEHGGKACIVFPLEESLACVVYPCYTMKLNAWNDCTSEYESSCGAGSQTREAKCIRGDGNEVDLNNCRDYVTGQKRLNKKCHIPCWNDCITTEWQPWSDCFGVCNFQKENMLRHGFKVRSRSVLQLPIKDGRKCPKDLIHQEKCKNPKCYTSRLIENPIDRTYECVRSDGLKLSHGCTYSNKTMKYPCKCPVENTKCIQNKYCKCHYGFTAKLDEESFLVRCERNSDTKQITAKALGLPLVIWVIIVGCVVYCMLIAGIIFVYKRYRKESKWSHHQETQKTLNEGLPLTSIMEMNDVKCKNLKHSRNLLSSTLPSQSSRSSGISSADESELQWSVDYDDQSLLNYQTTDQNDGENVDTRI